MSKPAMVAFPDEGLESPQSIFIAVVFPAPFAPRKPKISPAYTSSVTSFAAMKSPKRLVSLSVFITISFVISIHQVYKAILNARCDLFEFNVLMIFFLQGLYQFILQIHITILKRDVMIFAKRKTAFYLRVASQSIQQLTHIVCFYGK